MNFFKNMNRKENINKQKDSTENMSKDINENISSIKNKLGNSDDLVINLSKSDNFCDFNYASIYIENLVDKNIINCLSIELNEILKTIIKPNNITAKTFFDMVQNCLSRFRACEVNSNSDTLFENLVAGKTIFLVDACNYFLAIDTYQPEGRSVEEATSQTIIRGPKEAFTERININIALIRKRIKNSALIVENLNIGNISNTQISLMFIKNIAKSEIINEIKKRLGKIDIDAILDSSYIEELIKDNRYSLFPTILNSEKPDSVASSLLEGRVAILVDGSPYVLTAPSLFVEFLQVSEDYYNNYVASSLLRLLRYFSMFLSLIVPAIYIAITTFHQEMLPTSLVISIAAQREGVPFPALVESLLMEIIFEILREAGIRMPRSIGPSISIVGALVLGQAAVEAGLVSAAVVIVVSITAIASFTIPNYSLSVPIRLIRFIMMILASLFGLYGIFMGLIVLILHLSNLKSIGIPYLSPIVSGVKGGNEDTFIRAPLWKMKFRPEGISDAKTPRITDNVVVDKNQKEKQEFRS